MVCASGVLIKMRLKTLSDIDRQGPPGARTGAAGELNWGAMRNYVSRIAPAVAVASLLIAGVGCDTGSNMNRDLKREADRATIQLNRQRADLAAAQTAAEQATATAAAETKRADAAAKDAAELRQRLSKAETDLLLARQKVRELEEAALAARQGMPATRTVQP